MEDKQAAIVDVSVALIHYPVLDKHGKTIASAITNLDIHDIARSSKTYGVTTFYVVTPLSDQQGLARKIIGHWVQGYGGQYNPHRKEALELIRVMESVELVVDDIYQRRKTKPEVVVTSARQVDKSIGYNPLKRIIKSGKPYLLLFGTAWGLSGELMDRADYWLKPIYGTNPYNHLSVRSASAIVLDRLLARDE